MQDILDRGLGSEDRKTLRKLASVGASASRSQLFRKVRGMRKPKPPRHRKALRCQIFLARWRNRWGKSVSACKRS